MVPVLEPWLHERVQQAMHDDVAASEAVEKADAETWAVVLEASWLRSIAAHTGMPLRIGAQPLRSVRVAQDERLACGSCGKLCLALPVNSDCGHAVCTACWASAA